MHIYIYIHLYIKYKSTTNITSKTTKQTWWRKQRTINESTININIKQKSANKQKYAQHGKEGRANTKPKHSNQNNTTHKTQQELSKRKEGHEENNKFKIVESENKRNITK